METQTVRRLWALIKWLPADAAYIRSLERDQPKPKAGVTLEEFAQRHAQHVA